MDSNDDLDIGWSWTAALKTFGVLLIFAFVVLIPFIPGTIGVILGGLFVFGVFGFISAIFYAIFYVLEKEKGS